MIQVIRTGIYSGIREVVATFNSDAEVFAQLYIRDNQSGDSTFHIERQA